MRNLIYKLGLFKTVSVISLLSVFVSIIVTLIVVYLLNMYGKVVEYGISIAISIAVPLFIAPLISYHMTKLLLKIHHLELKMHLLASIDGLTQLQNRRSFLEDAKKYYNLANREKINFSILLIDIDDFKKINDTYGHHVGDKVLIYFGKNLKQQLRKSDLIGRVGGEEFVVLLVNSNAEKSKELSDRLLQSIKYEDNNQINLSASIGIAPYIPPSESNIEELIKQADLAMYQAKAKGKNCTVVYQSIA